VVSPTDADQGRVLVVRVWYEPGRRAGGFRARITATDHLGADRPATMVVASPEAVLTAVQRWLEAGHGGPAGHNGSDSAQ
jgi:hypothetical protein